MNNKKTIIRVMADYGCYPLWSTDPDGELDNVPPGSLSISHELADSLDSWAAEFDSILNMEDPASSGFATHEQEQRFNERGRHLAEWFARETGSQYTVLYFDTIEGKRIAINQ